MSKAPNYIVVATFSKQAHAEDFCKSFGVSYFDVIFNHGGLGLEARVYEDLSLQGITQDQSNALIGYLTRHIN
jgi:hypothetical protein